MTDLKAPFPWFGGKSRVADLVWDRFGNVPNYVEPFAGSLAVLLSRPTEAKSETVNDRDCYLANFWRAVAEDPEETAYWADWPVNEADLHSRHLWLVNQAEFRERMLTCPDFYSAKVAGWWVWGISQWIGSGWCSRPEWSGRGNAAGAPQGIHGHTFGEKVHRKLPRQGNAGVNAGQVSRQIPSISNSKGVHQKMPHPGPQGTNSNGISGPSRIKDYFQLLQARLRRVRVCCGDWSRILGPSPTIHLGLTGVFLDPPYSDYEDLYSTESNDVSRKVFEWAMAHAREPDLRIAVCGFEGEHEFPREWECLHWKATGGYANQGESGSANARRERIWFSPNCIKPPSLFDGMDRMATDEGRAHIL